MKARGNDKSKVALTIKNVRVINNFLIPFYDAMQFFTKKSQDFQDFKIICRAVHNGASRKEDIKRLILKLTYTMNSHQSPFIHYSLSFH